MLSKLSRHFCVVCGHRGVKQGALHPTKLFYILLVVRPCESFQSIFQRKHTGVEQEGSCNQECISIWQNLLSCELPFLRVVTAKRHLDGFIILH